MSDYPGAIYAPRTKENKDGVVYDPNQTTKLFAEDVVYDDNEIVAIETELGLNPKGSYADVAERLDNIGGGSSTELKALVACQINVSSVGDTYTDVAGDTYSETTNQTRLTMPANQTSVHRAISGHVSAGTGSFQLWNHTDSSSLAITTTTSTTEVNINIFSSGTPNNNSDEITIRVKNSGAGNTITIDAGGMMSSDNFFASSSTAHITATGYIALKETGDYRGFPTIGYCVDYSLGVLKTKSSSTATMQLVNALNIQNSGMTYNDIGNTFGTDEIDTVITRTNTLKIRNNTVSSVLPVPLQINISAITGSFVVGVAFQVKEDNI